MYRPGACEAKIVTHDLLELVYLSAHSKNTLQRNTTERSLLKEKGIIERHSLNKAFDGTHIRALERSTPRAQLSKEKKPLKGIDSKHVDEKNLRGTW
jgi:hypothetical protein